MGYIYGKCKESAERRWGEVKLPEYAVVDMQDGVAGAALARLLGPLAGAGQDGQVCQMSGKKPVFRIHIQLNPDPAKNLIPDPSYFLTLYEKKFKLLHNYKIFSSNEVN